MKSLRNKNLGRRGEEIAVNFLKHKGYKIIEQNFQKRYSELDIVALDGLILVFVEVKTRIGTKFGTGEEAVTPRKIRSLIKSAQYYKLVNPGLPDAMRIDLVSISMHSSQEVEKISHYTNITG